jgi:type IV pilus assembly protein PilW
MRAAEQTATTRPHPVRRAPQRGISLVEIMVGLALGLVLVTMVLRGFASTSMSAGVNASTSEFQTNGRYAMEVLKREVRHAAMSPLMWESSQMYPTALASSKNYGCGSSMTTDLFTGVSASGNNPYANTCLDSALTDRDYARGDVLTLRRLGLDAVTAFNTNAPYLRVSYGNGTLFLGGETPPVQPAPSFDYPLVTDVYYINTFTNSSDESPRVPALYRLRLGTGNNPTMKPELVASNVEHMRWQFAVADASGNVQYVNQSAVTDWQSVVAVRVWLLLRSTQPEAGLQLGSQTLGDITYEPNDNYRRLVLSTTISLRNR